MIETAVAEELVSTRFDEEFFVPSYDRYCVSNVPGTIKSTLQVRSSRVLPEEPIASWVTDRDVDTVVLLVADGLGYDTWLKHRRDNGFVRTMSENGLVFPITTVFPSTTAAALTTFATGLTPQEHGLPEWHVYMKSLDMIVATLPFSPSGEHGQDNLLSVTSPEILFSGTTLHSELVSEGVRSHALLGSRIAGSAYTRMATKGAEVSSYIGFSDMAAKLARGVREARGRTFIYAYWDGIDAAGHLYGPDSPEFTTETSTFSRLLQKEFLQRLTRASAKRTLFILCSDHGQLGVSPSDTFYLNRLSSVTRNFLKSDRGRPILPSWSPRDVALYVDDGQLGYVKDHLSRLLGDLALVLETREAVKQGLFGKGVPGKRFLERCGNLLVLPRKNHTVWYKHAPGRKFKLLGMHGGLTQTELFVPLAIANLASLLP